MSDVRATADTGTTISLAELLLRHADSHGREQFGGWLPGRVESYDESTCKASVSICLLEPVEQEDGTVVNEEFPIIGSVPVCFPGLGGAGGRRMRWDIASGDTVLLIFGARSLDRWFAVGGTKVDPGDTRHHDYNDAVAFPFLSDFAHVANAAQMINFTSGQIQVGGTKPLVTLEQFLNHTHATAGTGTPSPPVALSPTPALTGTTVIKGQ